MSASASAGSTMIPSCEFPTPISSSAHIIPSDSTPRILERLILKLSPSGEYRVVPTVATTTVCPAATFGAPHTICTGFCGSPRSTVVMCRWSLSGWISQVSTLPITMPARPPRMLSTRSTEPVSRPMEVRASARASAPRSVSRYSRSHLYDIFIVYGGF